MIFSQFSPKPKTFLDPPFSSSLKYISISVLSFFLNHRNSGQRIFHRNPHEDISPSRSSIFFFFFSNVYRSLSSFLNHTTNTTEAKNFDFHRNPILYLFHFQYDLLLFLFWLFREETQKNWSRRKNVTHGDILVKKKI